MKLKIYGDKLANAMAENRLLKFCLLLTVGITMVNAVVAYHAMNNQKVVILPPMVDHKIEIRGNIADDEYLKMMGRYSIKLLLDYTPSNAEQNFSDFLKLASPGVFSSMRSDLNKIIEEVIRLRISSSFQIHTINKLGGTNMIELIGLRSKYADDVRIDSAIENHFIEYEIDDGTFRVTGVSQKNGT
ncbi:MAG: TraE/TraK family type IV conjugative transfer system protein [Desulfosarcina sp.]|jgi:conjugal transfer pilus assembly protein TraE